MEIYLVKISKQDTQGTEQWADPARPFVVMSANLVNRAEKHFVGVPLTTKTQKTGGMYRVHVPVDQITPDPMAQYAFEDSLALADQVRAVSLDRVVKRVGTISKAKGADIEAALLYILSPRRI